MPLLELDARPEAVPQARTWARTVLAGWDAAALRDDVDLVLSELLANAVLHAPGTARVVLERDGDGVRLEVRDLSPTRPVRRQSGSGTTTGRGLNLVAALAQDWGVAERDDGAPGKAVWCVLTGDADEQVPDLDVDVDALLATFEDDDDGESAPRWAEVRVGEGPVRLLREAKNHLDGLLREIALAEGAGGIPREVVEPMASAVRAVASVRGQLRALLAAAAQRGDDRVDIVFRLPVDLADACEQYLRALAAADSFARDRRMLSLESPVEHRVLREWYVGRLVAGLRAAAADGPPVPDETFEARLLGELHRLQERQRAAERNAQLQRATAGLAAADSLEEIARIAVDEGVRVLGASGGALTRPTAEGTVGVFEAGIDVGVGARYAATRPLAGPSTRALSTGRPVLVESREDRDARFPGLAEVQPDVVAVAALPLLVAGEVLGAVRFSWDEPHVFSEDERALLDALAVQTGQAVARAVALQRLEALRDELDQVLQTRGQVAGSEPGGAGAALQAVRALSTSVRLEIALDAADVGSYEWNVRTGQLDWDDRLVRLLDVDPPDVDGTLGAFFARLHPDDTGPVHEALQRAVEEVGELAMTYRIVLRDGALRWIEARGRALPGPDGATERLVGVAVDVSSRQQGQERAERTLELMTDAFLLLDDAWLFRYVNREAERLLARDRGELLGRSIWEQFPEAVGSVFQQQYERAVTERVPVRFEQYFPVLGRLFEVRAHPGPDGLAVYFADTGARRAVERDRDQALARLAQVDAIGSALSQTLDVDAALTTLAALLVPAVADLCTVDLRDGDGPHGTRSVVTTGADPVKAAALREADALLPRRDIPGSSVHQVLSGRPLVHLTVTDAVIARVAADPAQARLWQQVQMRYLVVVPLAARGRVLGALSLLRTGDDARPFTDDDLAFVQDVGRRAGLLVDNVLQYSAQRAVAEDLQRSLLPDLPVLPGLALGAGYEPSSSAALVGGDWFDAFGLPDGGTGLVIGDVMGHDMAAAAAMGQLRSVLRTCAVDGDAPARVLERLDRLVSSFAMADLATVVYARLDRRPGGGALLTWSNAGHPAPLLLVPGGSGRYLEGGRGVMIGTGIDLPRGQAAEEVPPGSTVLMFTDGMVERRGRDLDEQLDGLARTAARLLGETSSPEELCHRLLAAVRGDGGTDDAAVVALRLLPSACTA